VALRKRVRSEDALILIFAFISVLYPLIIALLIHLQEIEEVSKIREVYSVLLGISGCEKVNDIVAFFEPGLLRRTGGSKGIKEICQRNRRVKGEVSEVLVRKGRVVFLKVKKGEVTLTLRVRTSDGDILVEDMGYVQGGRHRGDLR